jgi:hypothetical protein
MEDLKERESDEGRGIQGVPAWIAIFGGATFWNKALDFHEGSRLVVDHLRYIHYHHTGAEE